MRRAVSGVSFGSAHTSASAGAGAVAVGVLVGVATGTGVGVAVGGGWVVGAFATTTVPRSSISQPPIAYTFPSAELATAGLRRGEGKDVAGVQVSVAGSYSSTVS